MPSIPDYPPAAQPLDGSELVPIWQNGKQVSSQAKKLTDSVSQIILQGIVDARAEVAADLVQTGQDAAATAADRVQTTDDAAATAADRIQTGQDRIAAAASAQVVAAVSTLNGPYTNTFTATLPRGVTGTTSLAGGSGGTNGTFALGFSGGSITGMAGTFTVAGGAVTAIAITNPGLGSGTTPPTLSFTASAGLTGASATAVVGPLVAQTKTYWALSSDGVFELLWTNDGTSAPAAVLGPDGTQLRFEVKPAGQVVSGLMQYGGRVMNVKFGLVDTNLRRWMLCLDTGETNIDLDAESSGKVLAYGGMTTISGINQLETENSGGSYLFGQAVMNPVVDKNGRFLAGFSPVDGSKLIGKYDTRLTAAVTAAEGPALSRDGPFFSTIGGQIVAYYGDAVVVLTSKGTNSEPRALGDRVGFLSTRRRGLPSTYIMNIDGTGQRSMLRRAAYECTAFGGQSNTPGYISTPALTTTAPYPGQAYMFAGGAGPIAEYPAVFGGAGTLTDLHEDTSGAFKGESVASSQTAAWLDRELAVRPKLKAVAFGNGYPGHGYIDIKKGTGPYNDIIAQAGRLKVLGQAEMDAGRAPGVKVPAIVRAFVLLHGETDWNNASYDANLTQFQSDIEADIRAATGQKESVPMFITQMAALRFFATAPDTLATVQSPLKQLAASIANPKIFLVGPTYQFPTIDYAHWLNTSKRFVGELVEKVRHKVVDLGDDWVPLSPKPFGQWVVDVAGGTIDIPLNLPVDANGVPYALAWDTTLVTDPGNKGFNYTDAGGRTITNVQIVGANLDTIRITLSGSIVAPWAVDYGYSSGAPAANGVAITASISGTTLTVTAGAPTIGQVVSGIAVTPGTYITGGSGTTWTVNNSQTISSRAMTLYATGPTSGARGCLRNTDPTVSRWDGTTPLYDWCVIFRQASN